MYIMPILIRVVSQLCTLLMLHIVRYEDFKQLPSIHLDCQTC